MFPSLLLISLEIGVGGVIGFGVCGVNNDCDGCEDCENSEVPEVCVLGVGVGVVVSNNDGIKIQRN
jgi:hypothetical protein